MVTFIEIFTNNDYLQINIKSIIKLYQKIDEVHYYLLKHSLQMKVNNHKSNSNSKYNKLNKLNKSRCDVFVMAPLDVINEEGKPNYLNKFTKWCSQLKEGHVDGVMIDFW